MKGPKSIKKKTRKKKTEQNKKNTKKNKKDAFHGDLADASTEVAEPPQPHASTEAAETCRPGDMKDASTEVDPVVSKPQYPPQWLFYGDEGSSEEETFRQLRNDMRTANQHKKPANKYRTWLEFVRRGPRG